MITSILDGFSRFDEYAERCLELEMGYSAITDHGNISGWIEQYKACKKMGVKPIFGLESYFARKTRFDRDDEERAGPSVNEWDQRGPYHLTMLAQNDTGFKNLIKYSSEAFTTGFYVKPRGDYELLEKYSEGLIVGSGCLGGAVCQALLREDYQGAYDHAYKTQQIVGKDNYFIEVHDHGIEEQKRVIPHLIDISKKLGARLVPSCDSHYTLKAHAESHDKMLCVGTRSLVSDENRFRFHGPEFYLKSFEEMATIFDEQWLANSLEIAMSTDVNLNIGSDLFFPKFPDVPDYISPENHLRDLTFNRAKDKFKPLSQDYIDRLTYELDVIIDMGFPEYFLIVQDLIQWCFDNDIMVGPARGSAAGSLVAYCLGITQIDPLEYNLPFERFLVPGRVSPPDIDIDIDDRYRDRVIRYCEDKYGHDSVAHIATFAKVNSKSAIRDAARVMGVDYSKANEISKAVPPALFGIIAKDIEELKTSDLKDFYDKDPEAREVIDAAQGLEGLYRSPGIHAAGVVISPGPMTDFVPVMQKGEDQPVVTQWDMNEVEENGLLKIDFLGLRNLGVIDSTLKLIEAKGKKGPRTYKDIYNLPLDDADTYATLQRGETEGVFQVEGAQMRDLMISMHPTQLNDLTALLALYRPGPMGTGMHTEYIERKHGRKPVTYKHKVLEPILKETYGLCIYQEQMLEIVRDIAHFTPLDADKFRKVVGKKKFDQIATYREEFVNGSEDILSSEIANSIFDELEHFGAYAFSKNHSVPYSLITYITAYLKTHYPSEYMAALLSSVSEKKDRLQRYLSACADMEIDILPPSISHAADDFDSIDDTTIRYGFGSIDGVGPTAVEAALEAAGQEYGSLWSFFKAAPDKIIHRTNLRNLINAGVMDELSPNTSSIGSQHDLNRLLLAERNSLGAFISDHPLKSVSEDLREYRTHIISDFTEQDYEDDVDFKRIKIVGLITSAERKKTKKDTYYWKFRIEDLTGSLDGVMFNDDYNLESFAEEMSVICIEGTISVKMINDNVRIDLKAYSITDVTTNVYGEQGIFMKLNEIPTQEQVDDLIYTAKEYWGSEPVFFKVYKEDQVLTLQLDQLVRPEFEEKLQEIVTTW